MQALDDPEFNICLLSHTEFDRLLKSQEKQLTGQSATEEHEVCEGDNLTLSENIEDHDYGPYWDLLIVDDWDYWENKKITYLDTIRNISHKSIIITSTGTNAIPLDNSGQPSSKHYYQVRLNENVRSSRVVANYLKSFSEDPIVPAISEGGQVLEIATHWQSLSKKLLNLLSDSLAVYSPSQILIVVDPELIHRKTHTAGEHTHSLNRSEPEISEVAMTNALLFAAEQQKYAETSDSGQTRSYEERLDKAIEQSNMQSNPVIITTNGKDVLTLDYGEAKTCDSESSDLHHSDWNQTHVDARQLLNASALKDPKNHNAILVLHTGLSVGLEAELVIYIRDGRTARSGTNATKNASEEQCDARRRTQNHLLAMSSATHKLADIKVL